MTITGLDKDNGLTDPNPLEIEVKRAMIQAAKQTVLLIDESIFGVASLCPVVPLRRVDAVVTDCSTALKQVPALRSLQFEQV